MYNTKETYCKYLSVIDFMSKTKHILRKDFGLQCCLAFKSDKELIYPLVFSGTD